MNSLKNQVKDIIRLYKKDLAYLDYLNYDYYPSIQYDVVREERHVKDFYMIKRLTRKVECEKRIKIIKNARNYIGEENYMIIDHDFIRPIQSYWYMDYYSKATYYRKKHEAMKAFVDYVSLFLEF